MAATTTTAASPDVLTTAAPPRSWLERLALPLGVLLYALWATHVTWPLMSDPGDSVLGGIGDQTGGIAHLREWIESGVFPFAPGTVEDFSAPDGLSVSWGVNLSSWVWTGQLWLFALVGGPLAASALATWLGMVLSGVTMQILATRVTGSRLAGLVAGFAFAFYPYAVIKAASHPPFAHGWPLALLAWRMYEVAALPSRRNVVFAAIAAVLAVAYMPYYVLIGGVVLAACMVLALVAGWRRGELRRMAVAQLWIGGAVCAYVAVLAAITLGGAGGSGGTLRDHGKEELTTYAARAHEYVVPFGRNLFVGDETAPWLQARVHGSNFAETTLYLGAVVMLLGLVALVLAALRRLPPRLGWSAAAALVLAAVGFVWSAPPEVTVLGLSFPTPSNFVGEITTTWRVYSRFVVVVMLGAALLAAIGLAALMRGRRPWVAGLIAGVALAAVAADFTWRPGVTQIEDPPAYELLADRPGGIVAQYPLLPPGYGDSADLFYQDAHDHPMLNGYAETGFADRRASTLYYLNQEPTGRGLASLGVRYVFLPNDPAAYAGSPDPGQPGEGFRLVGTGQYGGITASVYEVTAAPDPGYAYVRTGAGTAEGEAQDPFYWLLQTESEIAVDAPQCEAPCRGRLRMRLASYGPVRDVTVRSLDGRELWRGEVTGTARDISLPVTVDERARVLVTTDPGPIPVNEIDPANPDVRPVSLAVSRLRFTR